MGKTRGRKKKSILENIVNKEDFPTFRVWSDLIDRTPVFQQIKVEKFWKLLEKDALNIYEEYGGNGRHRRLEKLFSLSLHSLKIQQPTSIHSSCGRFFVVPPPATTQQEKEEVNNEGMKWWEQVEQWLALREFSWGRTQQENAGENVNEKTEREEKRRMVVFIRLDEWGEQDLFQLERLLFRSNDLLQNDGTIGLPCARECLWFATTEPGTLYRNELRQWFHYVKVPSFRLPRWKDCYDALQEEIPHLLENDPWIQYVNKMYQVEPKELKIFYPQKFFVEIYFVETQRLRIRLQTTRKREFSWRQFWNEMQLLIYMLLYRIQEPNIQRFQWYLFAPNQFQFIPSLNP
jgi:hypothetical protein